MRECVREHGFEGRETIAATLLVYDSRSPAALQIRRRLLPYLVHFGLAFAEADLAAGPPHFDPAGHPLAVLIAAGAEEETRLLADRALAAGGGVAIFKETSGDSEAAGETAALTFADTPHFITQSHLPGAELRLASPLRLARAGSAQGEDVLLRAGDAPLLAVAQRGLGRLVRWHGTAWMSPEVLGPLGGLDDCLWRSLVWAARKPFVLRCLPPLVTMRVDDVAGQGGLWDRSPLHWAETAAQYGFKPWLGLFLYNLRPAAVAQTRDLIAAGKATAFPHAFGRPPREEGSPFYYHPGAFPLRSPVYDEFLYFDHHRGRPWTDAEALRGLRAVEDWYSAHAPLPMSDYILTHWYEMGANALAYVHDHWGKDLIGLVKPLDVPYAPSVPRLDAGPFPGADPPLPCTSQRPVYYGDFLSLAERRFFGVLTEIRDDAGYEWAPDNDVPATVGRGTRQLRRALDSLAHAVLFTHETDYIYLIEPGNWERELAGIAEGIAGYDPVFLTADEACRVLRAYSTSRMEAFVYDDAKRELTVELSGEAETETGYTVFTDDGRHGIASRRVEVPPFSGGCRHRSSTTP